MGKFIIRIIHYSEKAITAKRIEELKPSLCRWGYSSVNDMFY
jgi:hypothetical protein